MAKKTRKSKPQTSAQPPIKAAAPKDWVVLALAGLGLLITGYLTTIAWLDTSPALCAAGSDCDLIQQSRWSVVLGLPLSFWGFLTYAVIATLAIKPQKPALRWQRLWYVTLAGLAISFYLTLVGIIAVGATCVWCLASLGVLMALFVRLILQWPTTPAQTPWWALPLNSGVAALTLVLILHLYYNSDMLQAQPDPRLAELAEHLQTTGAVYYGASWCVACQEQKRLFRQAGDALPFVECSPYGPNGITASVCNQLAIRSYPTWIIQDQRFEGVLEPSELARRSGFKWE